MAEQELKASGKCVRKMTRDGLVEINLAEKSTKRVSERSEDILLTRNRSPDTKLEYDAEGDEEVRKNPNELDFSEPETDKRSIRTENTSLDPRGEVGTNKKQRSNRKSRLRFRNEEQISDKEPGGKPRDNLSRGLGNGKQPFDNHFSGTGNRSEDTAGEQKEKKRASLKKAQEKRYYYEKQDSSGTRPKIFFDKEEVEDSDLVVENISRSSPAGSASADINPEKAKDVKVPSGEAADGQYSKYRIGRGSNRKLIAAHRISANVRRRLEEESDENTAVIAASRTQGTVEKSVILQDKILRKRLRERSARALRMEEPDGKNEAVRFVTKNVAS